MQGQKNSRRTKRDPESRDFSCRCGKSYLSYAAAYTHVKQKHHLQKIYLQNIGKPQRERLPRGRPKEKKESEKGSDVEQLEILEVAILNMFQTLKDEFPKMIVEGNEHSDPALVQNQYDKLLPLIGKTFLDHREILSEVEQRFVKDLSRHFKEQVTARVQMVVSVLGQLREESDVLGEADAGKAIAELNRVDLWRGKNQINELILLTFDRWRGVHP